VSYSSYWRLPVERSHKHEQFYVRLKNLHRLGASVIFYFLFVSDIFYILKYFILILYLLLNLCVCDNFTEVEGPVSLPGMSTDVCISATLSFAANYLISSVLCS